MDIAHLSLTHFRNFSAVDDIAFAPGALLVAAAPNAVGKTNFIESIVVLLRGRSWRAGLAECVQWGEESLVVRGEIQTREASARVAVQYQRAGDGKPARLRIEENGTPASLVAFYGRYPVLVFLPEDTFLFSRGPEERRNFMNQVLTSLSPYLAALVQYQRALKQRNAALKQASTAEAIDPWTQLVVEHARTVWKVRTAFAHFMNSHLSEWYHRISGEKRTFTVLLETTGSPDELAEQLATHFATERRFGYTLYGPHRDDVQILTDDRPVRAVLSRGQVRSLVIALKLVAHRFLSTLLQEEPILLLDDILSELDEAHQTALLTHLPAVQTVLTCTSLPAILKQRSNVHALDLRRILATGRSPAPAPVPAGAEPVSAPDNVLSPARTSIQI
jgi:DNA replication and repair protein RecF